MAQEPAPIDGPTYLTSLLNQILYIHTNDTRMFVGEFKCTDNERNVILSQAYEYRPPSDTALLKRAASASSLILGNRSLTADMTSRFLGLIVVPGWCITKIETEAGWEEVEEEGMEGAGGKGG